ncbi:MAG TPA: prevent-host-death protein [Lactobacillus sp.]|nr:prevent-host-death protein [Lactobacillus sp.]
MTMIEAVTTRELRKNFKKYADDIVEYGDTVLVARPDNKNVVMISEKEYNSWQETNYLLKSEANRAALKHSIEQLGKQEHFLTLEEFESLNSHE